MLLSTFFFSGPRRAAALLMLAGILAASPALAGRAHVEGLDQGVHDRFIVTYRDGGRQAASARRLGEDPLLPAALALPARRGHALRLSRMRRLSSGPELVRASRALDRAEAATLMHQLAADPNVLHVEVDQRLQPMAVPNDPMLSTQWGLAPGSPGINVQPAWDHSDGAGVVVAIIDNGVYPHPDLAANRLPGYDFVSDVTSAADGDGRDADPTDMGDWAAAGQCGAGARATSSTWHGTHVAGVVAAVSNNGVGIAGVGFHAKFLPLRVGGKCGAYTSDILDAIDWASGGSVAGVPANAFPAEVINMSMGGVGVCPPSYQAAINRAVSRGSVFVTAAGNKAGDVAAAFPANCQNTIAVAASRYDGAKASFSNYGAGVDLTAPGQEIHTTHVNGYMEPIGPTFRAVYGTSMAAPHVAGVAALMQAAAPYPLTPARIEALLKATARPMPVPCPLGCGSGLLDAGAAVAAARAEPPPAPVTPPPAPTPVPAPLPTPPPPSEPVPQRLFLTGMSAAQGVSLNYQIDVPAGRTLVVRMDGGIGDADLYVQRNVPVTLSNWLCRPYKATSQETCTLTSPTAARYYIRVHAFGKFAGVRLSAGY